MAWVYVMLRLMVRLDRQMEVVSQPLARDGRLSRKVCVTGVVSTGRSFFSFLFVLCYVYLQSLAASYCLLFFFPCLKDICALICTECCVTGV